MSASEAYQTITKLTKALSAMTDERNHYKREAEIQRSAESENLMASRLGLTKLEGSILMTLYVRRGRVVSSGALMDAIYQGRDEPEIKIIQVVICHIRKKIGAEQIATRWGIGFSITETGVELVEKAMRVGTC